MFGQHDIDINLDIWKDKFTKIKKITSPKMSGVHKGNKHYKFLQEDRDILTEKMNNLFDTNLNWFFEFFYATEPVGLHNDYLQQYWDEQSDTRDIAGILIPIEWNCKQPYTIFFDKFSEGNKLIFRKGEMRDYKTNDVVEYRPTGIVNEEIKKYHPIGSSLHKQFADLKLKEVYAYKKNTAYVFDTRQWHSSSWFLDKLTVEPDRLEYKLIITGFGAIPVWK